MSLPVVNLNGGDYIIADDLRTTSPELFTGCRSSRNLLKRKRPNGEDFVPAGKYLFASLRKGCWVESTAEGSTRAKLFLERTWVTALSTAQPDEQVTVAASSLDTVYELAPPILHLTDAEKFKDNAGNVKEIETRGERQENRIFFLIKDVSFKLFADSDYVRKLITGSQTSFERGFDKDYVTMRSAANNPVSGRAGPNIRPTMFLTYKGLVRVLNVSQSPTARSFRSWAAKILQTVQMGDEEDRLELASRVIGIDVKTVQSVLNKCPAATSTVYLVSLGDVGTLRQALDITNANVSDDDIVAKFGRSADFSERLRNHKKDYGAIQGVQLGVMKYLMVDPAQLAECETEIKHHFSGKGWVLETSGSETLRSGESRQNTRQEIVIIPRSSLKQVEKLYESLQKRYGGQFHEIVRKLEEQKVRYEERLQHQEYKLQSTKELLEHKLLSSEELRQNDREHLLEKCALIEEVGKLRICNLEQQLTMQTSQVL